jgi:DNA-binding NarL/FixJ family response regulator
MACRVLIVEDDDLFAEFLTFLLLEDGRFEILGRARNGREAQELVRSLDPDVVTMDIEMPELDGVEATRLLLTHDPERRVVVVSSSIYAESAAVAQASGAAGFVSKGRAAAELAEILLAACRGAAFVDAQ